jgi:hypothetical protein
MFCLAEAKADTSQKGKFMASTARLNAALSYILLGEKEKARQLIKDLADGFEEVIEAQPADSK